MNLHMPNHASPADASPYQSHLTCTRQLFDSMALDAAVMDAVDQAAARVVSCLRSGHKVLFAGNGGSAADAQHMAGEYVSRFMYDRPGLPAIALTTDTSVLTAIGNDYGYAHVFARQLLALGRAGDIFIAYSTSGQSESIVLALEAARENGIATIGFTGNRGGRMVPLCDIVLALPSSSTPHIQEGHLVLGHILCRVVEEQIFPRSPNECMK